MTPERQPIAWRPLLWLAAAKLAVHLLSGWLLAWGYMTDELYFLDSTDRLDWGFVDHPPLSIALLKVIRTLFGDSLLAIRIPAALFGAITIVLTGLMARQLGGGATAQALAGLTALTAPVYLAMGSYYSMNPIDEALWALAMFLVLRIVDGGGARHWLLLGVVMGLGLLNKVSMLWFGAGLGVGLVLTAERRWLATPWPWAAAAVAALFFAPFVRWQWQNGWPFLEFSRNAALYKVGEVSLADFMTEQILGMNVCALPLWMGGLFFCFADGQIRRHRTAAWIFVTVFAMLAASGSARPHYLAPAFPIVLAAGAVAVERLARSRPWVPRAAATGLVVTCAVSAPIAIPLLPPAATVAYVEALGIRPREELERGGALPMHLALYFHADAVLDPVGEVYDSLAPEDRARVEILTGSFGETGAIDVLGRERGLPPSIGTHNQYWLWGPGDATGDLMIVVHDDAAQLQRWFEACEMRRAIDCAYCMEPMRAKAVYLCRQARRPMGELWPEMKAYR